MRFIKLRDLLKYANMELDKCMEVKVMVERKETMEELISFRDKNLIKTVTGIRRCEKSTILELYQTYWCYTRFYKKLM